MKKLILSTAVLLAVGIAAWKGTTYFTNTYLTKIEYGINRDSYISALWKESYEVYPDIEPDTESLLEENADFVGWIYYADCGISYPIVQETEDGEYVNKDFYGEENVSGTLFILNEEDSDFSQLNTFIYGNALNSGEMFGSLKNIYQNPAKYYTDPYIYIYTADSRILKYRVFSAYITTSDSEMYSIALTDDANAEYIEECLSLGDLSDYIDLTDEEIEAMEDGAEIITLVTTYDDTKRLFVQAVLIEVKDIK